MKKYSVILLNCLPDKKIKSIGNRCLIQIKKNSNILDYHINTIHKIFHNPEIILVNGFDNNKLKKYVKNKYKNLIYIEHDINDTTNIGDSLQLGVSELSTKNVLFINTNHILYNKAINTIKSNVSSSFALYSKSKGEIGVVFDKNKIVNCYYDLPNNLFEVFYIHQNEFDILIKNNMNLEKLYLFEVLNHYINTGINIKPVCMNHQDIIIINNMNNIKRVKKQLCLI